MSTLQQLRIGVIGCADIAWRKTLPAVHAHQGVRVAAVASRDGVKAALFAEKFGGDAVVGYQRLLDRPDVDAVYIPLPAMLHAQWIERALVAGKHVLAEKPLTSSYRQTAELTRLARARGLVLLENTMFLQHSQHAAVAGLLADDAIGELRGFSSTFTIPPKRDDDIRYQSDTGGGALLDIGYYPVRMALQLLGSDLTIVGAVLRHDGRRKVVLSGAVLLSTPQGVTAQLDFGMEHSYRSGYEISGSTGRLSLDRAFTPPETHRPRVRIQRQEGLQELVLPADDQFGAMVDFFVRAVRGDVDIRVVGDETVRQAMLLDEIAAAARHVLS